jgi:hypothetical protein
VDSEGWVFLLEPIQCSGEVGAFRTLGLNREGDDRIGNKHACHRVLRGAIREGVSRRAFDAKDRTDFSGANRVDILERLV